jgi:hypothetical protein
MNESTQFYEAGRLIQWALQPQISPYNEPEYRQLLEQFFDSPAFSSVVKSIAQGLGLEFVGENLRGLVLVPTESSIFAMQPSDYPAASKTVDERLMNGLIQIAILSTIFPRAQDLEEDAAIVRPPISIKEVNLTLQEMCDRLEAESRDHPDPSVEDRSDGLDETWRLCCRQANIRTTPTGRQSSKATQSLIYKGLEALQKQGCLQRIQQREEYRPTWRYRIMVQQFTAPQIQKAVRSVLDK